MRAGQREEGQKVIQRFQEFRTRGSGSTLGNNYLEQGRYAEAVASTGTELDLVDRTTPTATFNDATADSFASTAPTAKTAVKSMLGGRFRSSELNDAKRLSIVAS